MAKNTSPIEMARQKLAQTHEMISVSYHEAGHVIYGLLHSMKIEMVHLYDGEKEFGGFTHFDSILNTGYPEDSELIYEQLYSEICMHYAGLIAEKYHFKNISGSDKFPIILRNGSEGDTLTAAKLIKQNNLAPPGRKRYSYKKKLIKETLKELQYNWDDVSIIAHALFERRRLNFSDIKYILIKKTKNKDFWKKQFKNIEYIFENRDTLKEKDLKSLIYK